MSGLQEGPSRPLRRADGPNPGAPSSTASASLWRTKALLVKRFLPYLYHLPGVIPKATCSRTQLCHGWERMKYSLPCPPTLPIFRLIHHPDKQSNSDKVPHRTHTTHTSKLSQTRPISHAPCRTNHGILKPNRDKTDTLEAALNPWDGSVGTTAYRTVCTLISQHGRLGSAGLLPESWES